MLVRLCLWVVVCAFGAVPALAEEYFVKTQAEYFAAAKNVKAGDIIILANGNWKDFEIVLSGRGTVAKPIVLISETPGKVVITGQSNLRIGGEHILVTGLTFLNGYSPTGEVLSFRRTKEDLARNSRMTEMVVDGFSKPDRYESDYWVAMYGQNNRFDHNYLAGKTNKGVTFAVRLDSADSRKNNHRIDHNYFGHRPVLGSNGGETIRIGTSQYSMFNSNTVIEDNYFERTDGEVEIISIKSGKNIVRGNVFDASSGAVTLRHGNGNIVERNVFLGRGKDHTGGIRVINADQIVRGNYMEGLRGTGFSGALTIMNGVPNSPVNRYVQVSNAQIDHNSILDSDRVTFGAGADKERSAPPVTSTFSNNLLAGADDGTFIEVGSDITGISFSDNRLIQGKISGSLPSLSPNATELKRAENGLLYPVDPRFAGLGAPRDLKPVKRDETGPSWYPKPDNTSVFGKGEVIQVVPGEGTLEGALALASPGATLKLLAGEYYVNKTLRIDVPLTVAGSGLDGENATLIFSRPSLFEMAEGGSLRLQDLQISGRDAPDNVGNNIIRTSAEPIRGNFEIELERISVTDLTVNRNFDVIVIAKNAFADSITIKDCTFSDITGDVVKANAETDDYGQYGVEYLTISGSKFKDIGGQVVDLYRGGTDESTFGPHFKLSSSTMTGVGGGAIPALKLQGVQQANITGSTFTRSGPIKIINTVGTPRIIIAGNSFDSAQPVIAEELNYVGEPRVILTDNSVAERAQ
ncbi:MAG: polysaccharide lyase 6 family protein [Pontixanthobacter sp.]